MKLRTIAKCVRPAAGWHVDGVMEGQAVPVGTIIGVPNEAEAKRLITNGFAEPVKDAAK